MNSETGFGSLHACPQCHLRFTSMAELQDHLHADHPTEVETPPEQRPPLGCITVPMDPDRPAPIAFAVATQMARQAHCEIDMVAAPGMGLHEGAEAFLHARSRELRADGFTATTSTVLGLDPPAAGLLAHAASLGSDLLCMSTRASHGPLHLLFGSVAEAVMRGAELPVLLVGPKVTAPTGPYGTVLACVDGSTQSELALAVAQRLAEVLHAELLLVEVLRPESDLPADTYEGAELVHIAHALDPQPAGYEVLHGTDAVKAIVDHTQGMHDTIVVTGTHGRTGLRSLVMGSVAHGIVAASQHPTLVVPPGIDAAKFLRPVAITVPP